MALAPSVSLFSAGDADLEWRYLKLQSSARLRAVRVLYGLVAGGRGEGSTGESIGGERGRKSGVEVVTASARSKDSKQTNIVRLVWNKLQIRVPKIEEE